MILRLGGRFLSERGAVSFINEKRSIAAIARLFARYPRESQLNFFPGEHNASFGNINCTTAIERDDPEKRLDTGMDVTGVENLNYLGGCFGYFGNPTGI